ncbi:hypothetical protein R6G71_08740, partial [Actinobaculum suis]
KAIPELQPALPHQQQSKSIKLAHYQAPKHHTHTPQNQHPKQGTSPTRRATSSLTTKQTKVKPKPNKTQAQPLPASQNHQQTTTNQNQNPRNKPKTSPPEATTPTGDSRKQYPPHPKNTNQNPSDTKHTPTKPHQHNKN